MIGSLMSRMGEAQKLSIPQLQQAIQNGTLPPYVGIPLLQEKVQQQKQAQAMQAPQQAPIAEQVMQEASAVDRERGLSQLPSNLPENYAHGGIIAFAGGGLPDDRTEDDELEELFPTASTSEADLINLIAQGAGRSAPRSSQEKPSSRTESEKPSGNVTSGGIKDIINNAAKRYGLPPELLQRISGSESNYNPNVTNQTGSSAKGLFQFLDSTWAGMGGKPGEQYDPEINANMGSKYIRQNAEYLKKSLGRDPKYGEIYTAHFFGPQGAASLISRADPRSSIEEGLATYSSPDMVRKIMKQNPNLKGKTVGQVLGMLEKKTGEGIVSLAQGGVAHYDDGGDVDARNPLAFLNPGDILSGLGDYMRGNWEKNKAIRERKPITDDREVKAMKGRAGPDYQNEPIPGEKVGSFSPYSYEAFDEATKRWEDAQKEKNKPVAETPTGGSGGNAQPPVGGDNKVPPPPVTTEEAKDPYIEKLRARIEQQLEDARAEGDMNKYLALMQAGLSMMGGSSPYAAVNFGQGASQGLGAYNAMNQATRKNINDIQAQELGLYKYEQAAKNAAETRRMNDLYKNLSLKQGLQIHGEDWEQRNRQLNQVDIARYRDDYSNYINRQNQLLLDEYAKNPKFQFDPKIQEEYAKKKNAIRNSPEALDLYKRAFPDIAQNTPSGGGNVIKFDSSGQPIK